MLLIMMTFLGFCWIIKFRAFKQEEKAFLATNTAIIIPMQQRLHKRNHALLTVEDKIIPLQVQKTPIALQQAK